MKILGCDLHAKQQSIADGGAFSVNSPVSFNPLEIHPFDQIRRNRESAFRAGLIERSLNLWRRGTGSA